MRVETMEVIEINSLTKFVSEIVNYKNYFFRGEPQDYFVEKGKPRNRASGFRWMEDNNKSFFEMKNLRNDYYQEIGYSLSKKDEDNFIAYCQHHGLPTELIDITENPLVALYFACEKDRDYEGMVYLFNKVRFNEIPIKKSMVDKKISEQSFNLFDFISVKTPYDKGSDLEFLNHEMEESIKVELTNVTKDGYDVNGYTSIKSLIRDEVIKQYKIAFTNNPEFLKISGPNFYGMDSSGKDIIPHFDEKQDIIEMFKDESKALGIIKPIPLSRLKSIEYLNKVDNRYNWDLDEIIWDLFAEMVDNQEVWGITVDFSIFPYYIHRPSVKFDRMVNQQGIFIVQQFFNGRHQELIPDFVFKISNKNEILQELDRIGISKKFIYPDHDNIAQYIKDKMI